MKVFKKTRRSERFVIASPGSKADPESTDLPVETPKSAIWGWLELGCAVTLASAVLVSMLQLLVAAANLVE
jgi:hypothetical protein